MTRPLLLALGAGVGGLLALAPAAGAAGTWGTVETVSRLPGPASAAIDDRGYTVLVWSRGIEINRRVYGARRTPTRGFGEPFGLHTAEEARRWRSVTFDKQRNAIVAWHLGTRTESRTVRPNGARTDRTTVVDFADDAAQFAAVAPGTFASRPVLAGTPNASSTVKFVRAREGLLTGPPVIDELPGSEGDQVPGFGSVAFGLRDDGTLVAAYTDGPLLVSERAPGGRFAPPQRVPDRSGSPRVAIGPDGTLAVAWEDFTGIERTAAFVSVRAPGGQFSAPVRLSTPEERPTDLDVVVTTEGAVRVAYLAARNDGPRSIGPVRLVTLGAGSETLSAPGLDAGDLELAADGRGGTTVAWQRTDDANGRLGNAIFARAITPSGRVGKRWKLTRTGEDGTDIALAVAPDGSALVAWTSGEGLLGDRLRAIRRAQTGD